MGKFKVGDRLLRTVEGPSADGVTVGETVVVRSLVGNGMFQIVGGAFDHDQENYRHAYPNPPHKHAELIKAWADGADIQRYSEGGVCWVDLKRPVWDSSNGYRIKPTEPSPAEKERDEIRVEMERLTKRLEALEVK
jgi:hypothetical protein